MKTDHPMDQVARATGLASPCSFAGALLVLCLLLLVWPTNAFAQSSRNAQARLAAAQESVSRVNSAAAANRSQLALELAQRLRDAGGATAATRDELTRVRNVLMPMNLPAAIIARHDSFTAEFERRAATFDRASQAWLAADNAWTLSEVSRVLNEYAGPKRKPIDAGKLPWGGKPASRMPAEAKGAWYQKLARDLKVELAQAGNLTTIGGVRFTNLPESGQAPEDADLAETPSLVLSSAVRAKAQELGNNPVEITNWLHNNIRWVPTWGGLQTADTTLRSFRGNALDTASLHIALLRAAGIPARFQFGTIELPVEAVMNWVGGVQQPEAALRLLNEGGIAARGITANGRVASVRMEHVWVSAYVNWTPSRGARQGGWNLNPAQHPNPNGALNAWVPLDASYKQYTYGSGINLAEVSPFNAQALVDASRQGATCTPASATQLNLAALTANYAQFKSQAQLQLSALGGEALVGQVLGTTALVRRSPSMLAGVLPYATVVVAPPVAAVSPSLNWRAQIGLLNGLDTVLSLSRDWNELNGQPLSLGFTPETAADAQALAALLRPDAGGDAATGLPTRIPAYLVKFKAQLRLNGQVVGEGGSFTLGETLTLRTAVQTSGSAAPASADSLLTVGEMHVWAMQAQAEGAPVLQSAADRLSALRAQLQGAVLPAGPDQAAQTLGGLAAAYQAITDAKSRLYQRAADVVEVRQPSIVRASSRFETDSAFGLVTYVRASGVGLHVDRFASASAARGQAGDAALAGFGQQGLERASATAHQLLDRAFGPTGSSAQSALSGLALSVAQGRSILRADSATLGDVLGALDPASTLREQLEQAVANGHQVLLPPVAADFGGLPMDSLVLQHPQSGAAAYLVTSRNAPVVQLTAQRPGFAGWLGLADSNAAKALAAPVIDALIAQINTAQALVGDIDSARWQAFGGQADVIDGLYQGRVSANANTANACDWLVSTLSSQLGSGLPSSPRVNRAPVITSQPAASALLDQPYSYNVVASDPDGDALAFTLVGAPTGMAVDPAGRINWPRAVAGQFNITVQASDGLAVAQQSFMLSVGSTAPVLNVDVALSPAVADAGQTVTLTVSATSSAGAVTRTATLDGGDLLLSGTGVATFAAPAAGTHRILITASDGQSTTTRELILTVRNAGGAAAVALIASPAADASLRAVAAISGTASGPNFAYYQLLLRRVGESDLAWQEVSRALTPITNGPLGQVDTSRYDNGLYQIALRVVDVNGGQTLTSVTVDFVGNLKLGQFRLSFADVRAEAPGVPLMLTRTYDSTKKDAMSDFGYGWSASGHDITVKKNMTFGSAWEVTQRQLQLCLAPVGRRRISINLPDGGLYRFDAKNAQECAFGAVPQVDIQFTAVPGPTGGSSGRVSAGAQLTVMDGALVQAQGGQLVDTDTGLPWNPKDFELITEEGFKYALREGAGVLSVTDPYGNKVSYGSNGYTHSATLSVIFTRDAQGRITKATDPSGKSLTYSYNSQGELQSVTDRDGKVTSFSYATVVGANSSATSGNVDLKHLLASITDPRGQVVMSNQFDALGRLTGTADALGQTAQQEFDLASNKQSVTDRRGNRTVYTFDADGNVTQSVNALGQTTTFTFDANGNETSVTNALNEKTEREFEPVTGKQLSEKNPLGHTVSTAYPTVGTSWQRLNPLSTTDARGNATTYSYESLTQPGATPKQIAEPLGRSTSIGQDIKGNLTALNIAGEATSYGYDSRGRRTRETNGLGQSTTYTFDANGNETSRTLAKSVNGATVTFTTSKKYDAENRVIEETDALGGKRVMAYAAAGKLASQTDSLARKTSYSYDANARLTRTDHPDGTSEATAYDAEGNEVSKTDRAGRTTRMSYDALNRLVRTDHPDGSSEATEFDPAGRVTATIDRNGKRSTMEYDAAGRQTASTDATGRRTTQTFDENGNRLSVTLDGRTTRFSYDALNRLTQTTWPDGSQHTSVYRPDNRKQSETDPRGVVTSYGYDAAGRLSSLAQSLSATGTATTSYGYDESGTKVRQLDALGRTTTWSLDGNARITARKLHDGATEASQYDSEGNRLAKTTFAGEQLSFQYDPDNRLTGQVIPAGAGPNSAIPGAAISYGYSPSGQLVQQTEQGPTTLGGSQSYKYDANDRLIEVKSPLGQINYSLDANGNITQRSVANAGTTNHEYDDAGRVVKLTAPDGKQARYSYDAAGRLTTTERDLNPKGGQAQTLVSHHRHDAADRLVSIAQVKKAGASETVLAGQALTRSTGGTIARIDTYRSGSYDSATGQFSAAPARTQAFEYDANARLTRETDSQGGASTDSAYEYSAVGNRTKKTITSVAGVEITSYSYDSADRLTQESVSLPAGGTKLTTYSWDGNGNLASRAEPGKVTLYRFDPQNRLIDIRTGATQAEAGAANPSVSYAYDASGNRVKKGGANPSSYLVDSTEAFPQIALETKGAQSTSYVRGTQLVRQTRLNGSTAEDLFPLHGHLGTSLGAADAEGSIAEQVDSDAFGNLQTAAFKETHLFTGEYWDQDAQLLYLRARWYDPRIGRFISADPFEGKQNDPRSLNRYSYAHSDPVQNADPTGEMTLGDSGAAASAMGALSSISLPTVGMALATARTTHLAVASVPFMAAQGPRIVQLVQGSGRAGLNALSISVQMVARGTSATQQQIQSAYTLGSSYTANLNQILGTRASSLGLEIHKLLETSLRLPPSLTYSLANMAPTPIATHRAISALHSTGGVLTRNETLRQTVARLIAPPNAQWSVEQAYVFEARIWAAAMQGQQLTPSLIRSIFQSI